MRKVVREVRRERRGLSSWGVVGWGKGGVEAILEEGREGRSR